MGDRVLIAGCGDVGNALAARLLADGCEVWGIRRRVEALAPGVKPWRVDLRNSSGLGALPAAFDVLFYTASADHRDEEHYRSIYVHALRDLLQALREARCPLRRVFFTSSTAVYGQSRGQWVDETSVTEPSGFNGRVLLEAESLVRQAPERGINVRLSGIYGPGRTRLVRQTWSGEAKANDSWTNRIHVEDCAGALHHLMRLQEPAGLYLASDDEPATSADVVRWLSAELGVKPPPIEQTERLNKRCRNARLRDGGFQFRYPTFRDGYRSIARQFLQEQRAAK